MLGSVGLRASILAPQYLEGHRWYVKAWTTERTLTNTTEADFNRVSKTLKLRLHYRKRFSSLRSDK